MKTYLILVVLFASLPVCRGEETAVEVARRVIRDKSPVTVGSHPRPIAMAAMVVYQDSSENRLVEAANNCGPIIEEYILNEGTPEPVLLAYAIRVLRSKRIPWETNPNMLGVDTRKNQGYLNDGLMLAARLDEIVKAQKAGSGHPAPHPALK